MEAGTSRAPLDVGGPAPASPTSPTLEGYDSGGRREELLPLSPAAAEAPRAVRTATAERTVRCIEKQGLNGKRYRVFTAEEVRRHNTPDDCWLIAHGRVYDVTRFLQRHPAGDRSILRHAGTDSTIDFDFHPMHAQKMWAPFMLGYLEGHDSNCTVS